MTARSSTRKRRKAGPEFRFIDLFAGIGGIRQAMESAGDFECVFSSEWDRFARQTYRANFGEEPAGDIAAIKSEDIPEFDVLCAGFPCQPFSIAGVSKKNALGREHGFLDQTQGTLFFEIARIIRDHQPRAILLENVKNLVSHDRGRTFETIRRTLEEDLGYTIQYQVINASQVLPQNRERIFIVGFRDADAAERFAFPEAGDFLKGQASRMRGGRAGAPRMRDILEKRVDDRYILSDKLWKYLQDYKEKHRKAGHGFGFGLADLNGISRTLSARYYKDGSEILIPRQGGNPRRLTPRECARLMGFPDEFEIVVSDTQAYRQFGNSVAVPVVRAVGRSMFAALTQSRQPLQSVTGGRGQKATSKAGKSTPLKKEKRKIA